VSSIEPDWIEQDFRKPPCTIFIARISPTRQALHISPDLKGLIYNPYRLYFFYFQFPVLDSKNENIETQN